VFGDGLIYPNGYHWEERKKIIQEKCLRLVMPLAMGALLEKRPMLDSVLMWALI